MDPSQGDLASISHLVPAKSRFNLLVIRDGVIVDNVGFRPRAGFGNTDRPWPFTINLDMPEGLDGVTLTYFISVRGNHSPIDRASCRPGGSGFEVPSDAQMG